jgi:hypothetical protein
LNGPTVYVRLAARGLGTLERAPELERLLAQASAPVSSTAWREDAYRVIAAGANAPPVAAAALCGSLGVVPGRWVCMASPVHLVAGMSNVTLPADGVLEVGLAESAALATDFNRVFDDPAIRLLAAPVGLLCVFDRLLEVGTHDPIEGVGRDVFGLQPAGPDAPRLRRLMSEMELWLFEHAVNRARAARGDAVITGLWLWGGGEMLNSLPAVQGWTAGADPLFAAFGAVAEFPRERAAAARAGVWVCGDPPGAGAWHEVEARWLAPLSAALRAGDIARVTLSVADRVVSVERSIGWRFWRRAKPWWEAFGLAPAEDRLDEVRRDEARQDAGGLGDARQDAAQGDG